MYTRKDALLKLYDTVCDIEETYKTYNLGYRLHFYVLRLILWDMLHNGTTAIDDLVKNAREDLLWSYIDLR